MGLFSIFKASKTVVVVDGVSLNGSLGMKGRVPPRNQLQVLRRLSRFAESEKVSIVVVLSGTPLNKAPAGKKFEGITVLYSKSPEVHAKYVVKTAVARGAGSILVSADAATEKLAMSRKLATMRVSTFRKVFDIGGGSESEGSRRSERGGGNERSNRPPRRRQQKKPATEKKPEQPEKKTSENDVINELIDLVD